MNEIADSHQFRGHFFNCAVAAHYDQQRIIALCRLARNGVRTIFRRGHTDLGHNPHCAEFGHKRIHTVGVISHAF